MYSYEKREDGYYLMKDSEMFLFIGDTIGLSYQYYIEDGVSKGFVYKHGKPNDTLALHDNALYKYKGARELFKSMNNMPMQETITNIINGSHYIEFKFDIDELNKLLTTSSYIVHWHEKNFKVNQ